LEAHRSLDDGFLRYYWQSWCLIVKSSSLGCVVCFYAVVEALSGEKIVLSIVLVLAGLAADVFF